MHTPALSSSLAPAQDSPVNRLTAQGTGKGGVGKGRGKGSRRHMELKIPVSFIFIIYLLNIAAVLKLVECDVMLAGAKLRTPGRRRAAGERASCQHSQHRYNIEHSTFITLTGFKNYYLANNNFSLSFPGESQI